MIELQIDWNKNIEPVNKAEIEKFLKPYLWLVPKWCQKLTVNLYPVSEENSDNAIETTTYYDYRRIKMDFFSGWLTETDEVKQMHIVHDLLHGFTSIAIDYAVDQFNILAPDGENEKLNKSMRGQMSILCESMTQDLAFAIVKKCNEMP